MVEARPESREVVELRQPEDAVDPVVEDPLPDPGLDLPGDCTERCTHELIQHIKCIFYFLQATVKLKLPLDNVLIGNVCSIYSIYLLTIKNDIIMVNRIQSK